MPFEPIRRILPRAIQNAGISRQVTASRIIESAGETVNALWGEEKAAFVRAVSFHDGILKLVATSPAALQELRLWDVRLQNELNRRIGSKVVQKIVFYSETF